MQKQAYGETNFEYTGQTALNITGKTTGKQYRFEFTGDIKAIDNRDAASMMGISVLKMK